MAGKRNAISTYNIRAKSGDKVPRDDDAQALFMEFARRLQGALERKGWSQSEFARACDKLLPKPVKGQLQNKKFGRDTISHYIRGVSLPRPERLAIIARALGMEPGDLLPDGVPSGGASGPSTRIEFVGGGRVFIRINRTVSYALGVKLMTLVRSEDPAFDNKQK